MNERVKELARQANLPLIHDNFLTAAQEKFAELIVKDCMGLVYDGEPNYRLIDQIKQHFGVEE